MFEQPRAFAQQRKIVRDLDALGGAYKKHPTGGKERE
jgi:hypothetical protein